MNNPIKELKTRWTGWREKRFLETHGCKTWREYERRYDSDIGPMARWAHTYYHGYKFIWSVPDKHYIYYSFTQLRPSTANHALNVPRITNTAFNFDVIDQMADWCEQNCQGKWRNDWLRGLWDNQDNFEFNEIGGGDVMFFAFKEESDYTWFSLRWS